MLGLVNRPNDISVSRANQSPAKFKSAVGENLLQSWVNLTVGYDTRSNWLHLVLKELNVLVSCQKEMDIRNWSNSHCQLCCVPFHLLLKVLGNCFIISRL